MFLYHFQARMHCINMVSEGCRLSCSVPLGFKRILLFFVFVTDLKVGENKAQPTPCTHLISVRQLIFWVDEKFQSRTLKLENLNIKYRIQNTQFSPVFLKLVWNSGFINHQISKQSNLFDRNQLLILHTSIPQILLHINS